jgi:hypothetical protein
MIYYYIITLKQYFRNIIMHMNFIQCIKIQLFLIVFSKNIFLFTKNDGKREGGIKLICSTEQKNKIFFFCRMSSVMILK